jgi:hypothetical protein
LQQLSVHRTHHDFLPQAQQGTKAQQSRSGQVLVIEP